MRTNVRSAPVFTHEGGLASRLSAFQELERTILACLLWENTFYESGEDVAERIKRLVSMCDPQDVAKLAIEARSKHQLRHAPLLLVRELARRPTPKLVEDTLVSVIQRADELSEFLSLYWAEGKTPISKQVKRGLARAFQKFNAYQLAKYNRDAAIKLRDVLFLVHAKPKDEEQAEVWKKLVDGTLEPPDTWEVALSGGADKRATFERLIAHKKIGYLALLRNLRNMQQAGVDPVMVHLALREGAERSRALPFRFVAAARTVPSWEPALDEAMQLSLQSQAPLKGRTAVLVDVSGSMDSQLSARSDLTRLEAAAALAVLVVGVAEEARVFTFRTGRIREVPPRKGMALIDAIGRPYGGTELGSAVKQLNRILPADWDRIIVITDEQSSDPVGAPTCKGYLINVASNQRGVGYGQWTHIHGFSEAVVSYLTELENMK